MASSDKNMKKNEDFNEEDIWEVMLQTKNPSSFDSYKESSSKNTNNNHQAPWKTIPIPMSRSVPIKIQSAPVNIPDWSKIYGSSYCRKPTLKKPASFLNHGIGEDDCVRKTCKHCKHWDSDEDEDEDDDEDEGKTVPPHEWIARKLARTQISSFSVCEGIGRTLKGRDLSNVRNTVLTRTGFLEKSCGFHRFQ